MTTYDPLHTSIASALVAANFAFATFLDKTPDGNEARTFRLPFAFGGNESLITGYVGGATLTVLAAIRFGVPAGEITAKRHLLADAIVAHQPHVRLFPHPYAEPLEDADLVWVEAAVPVPTGGQPIDPWLAVTPFLAVVGAMNFLTSSFPQLVKAAIATSFPMLIAGHAERVPVVPGLSK